jgi:tRNA C32,U32 (ribose-2'-O)-methylase TrmJ
MKNFETDLNFIENSTKKDSLQSLLSHFYNNAKSLGEIVNLEKESFITEFKNVIADSGITDQEISNLTSILKRAEYEKFKSN